MQDLIALASVEKFILYQAELAQIQPDHKIKELMIPSSTSSYAVGFCMEI